MPPARNPEPVHRKKRKQEGRKKKTQCKKRSSNHTDLNELASLKKPASLAQARITRPVGTFRNIKESKRACRSDDGSFSKQYLKKRVEQDLQSILNSSGLRRSASPGPSRQLLQNAPSPERSSFLTPVPHRTVLGDSWTRSSVARPEDMARSYTKRLPTEAPLSEGDGRTSAMQRDILTETVSKLQAVLAEKCRTLYRTANTLQSVRRFIQERCLEEETSEHSTVQESDSEGSAMSTDEPVQASPPDVEATLSVGRGTADDQRYHQPGSFPAIERAEAGSNSVVSLDVLYGDIEPTRRSCRAGDGTQRDSQYRPAPLPSPPLLRNTQARPPSNNCSTSRQVEWIDLTESPPPPPTGIPRPHTLHETSDHQQYDVVLPGYGSDALSDEDFIPPSPPVQRKRRRLVQSNFYSPVDFKTVSRDDLDEDWCYVPQKMF